MTEGRSLVEFLAALDAHLDSAVTLLLGEKALVWSNLLAMAGTVSKSNLESCLVVTIVLLQEGISSLIEHWESLAVNILELVQYALCLGLQDLRV